MTITIKDIARKARVSISTASRVMGNYGYVSLETRERVLAAARELEYRPNVLARSLVTRSTFTMGLVLADITNPFFALLARGVESVTWGSGYTLFLANTDEDLERERAAIHALQERQVDGMIVAPASQPSMPHLVELVRQCVPLVLVDREAKDLAVDQVLVDNEAGAYQAVSHLLSLGHRRIDMVVDDLYLSTNAERLAGYKRALEEAGLPGGDGHVHTCKYTEPSAYGTVCRVLDQPDPPTAFFTANNFMTLGAWRAVRDHGMSIPGDVALVGFDDLEWSGYSHLQLTAVIQPVHEMGRVAAQRLLSRLEGDKSPPASIRLKTQFVVRGSSGV